MGRPPLPVTEAERLCRRDVCELCGARPGQPCREPSRRPRRDSHAGRYRAAVRRGDLPLPGDPLRPAPGRPAMSGAAATVDPPTPSLTRRP